MCLLEREAQWYWNLMSEIADLRAQGADQDILRPALEEMEVLAAYATRESLRRLATRQLTEFHHTKDEAIA